MKPLQTHGRYIEEWIPGNDRFCQFESSDEEWARPLGYGEVVRTLAKLYDVRDIDTSLIGYTKCNPTDDFLGGHLYVPILTENPPTIVDPVKDDWAQLDTPAYEALAVHAHTISLEGWDSHYLTWIVDLSDAEKLARCGWLECLGEDNIRKFVHDLRMRRWKQEQQMRTFGRGPQFYSTKGT